MSPTGHDADARPLLIDLSEYESADADAHSADDVRDRPDGAALPGRDRAGLAVDRRPARPGSGWTDLAIVVLIGAAVVWVARTHGGVLFILGAGVLGAGFVARRELTRHEKQAAVLTAMVGAAVIDYLVWRAGVINWQAPWLSVPLYAAEVFAALHILGFHYTLWPREPDPPADDEDPTARPIFILVPTVDEGVDIVSQTVHGALAARSRYRAVHPDARVEIVVCNDGGVAAAACSGDIEAMCGRLGIRCVTRVEGGGAKAGNLEHARREVGATGDALLVLFDADHVAEPEFLLATIPSFRDSSVAWVQTGQHYRNLENPVARWANDQQAIFYGILSTGKAATNSAYICGTNVVIRAAALDEIGGFPQTSVTEDLAASIVLHRRWRSVFVPGALAHGLGPVELGSYFGQQRRWARGSLGVLRRHWRDIFVPSRRSGLHPEQRAQYALATTHYLCGLRDLVYVAMPIVFLVTGIAAVRGADLEQFLAHFVAYWLLTQIAFWHAAKGKTTWRGVVIGFGSFPVLAVAALRGLIRGDGAFTVTPKRRLGNGALRHIGFHIACFGACVGAIAAAIVRGGGAPVLISSVWAAYTGVLLAAFIGLAVADRAFAHGRSLRGWPAVRRPRVSRQVATAFGVAAIVLAVAVDAFGPGGHEARAAGTVDRAVGLDITTDLLATAGSGIDARLGYHVDLVGRTQQISDHFDRAWAQALADRGARPWVTLLFSAPSRPKFEASLLSVANGVHDAELRRWAREIAAWGRPVDVTVLPQVDRDWAVTSAVANSGIPEDSARAWTRVRSVFRAEGANNAIWIWAPADPAADGPYAPPAGTYDAVALTLIEYPGTKWPDPQRAIDRVRARHPGIPLFVETSMAGSERRRIDWLRRLGVAIGNSRDVAALIYHEGGPMPVATPAERAAWSITADPVLAAAFGRAAGELHGITVAAEPVRRGEVNRPPDQGGAR